MDISNRESFEASLATYMLCLEAASSDPKSACDIYGNFNVAAEIKLDLIAGIYLVQNPSNDLSEQIINDIFKLANMARLLPGCAVAFTKIIEQSYENMSHDSWVPIRYLAGDLLKRFKQSI